MAQDSIDLPMQLKEVQKERPVELTPNQVSEMIKDKREGKAQIGLLTQKNLEE